MAQEAIEASVEIVCIYGSDGTVMEVAHGVKGGELPVAILPGGKANVLPAVLPIVTPA